MKTCYKAIGLLAFCAAVLPSCVKETLLPEANSSENVTIGFTASLSDEDLTKTSMTIGDNNSTTFSWDASDKLKVRQIYYRGSTLYSETAVSDKPVRDGSTYKLSAKFVKVEVAPDAYFTGGNRYMYQGFYPNFQVREAANGAVTVKLPAFQKSRSEVLFDENADILYADAVYAKSQRTSEYSGRTINGFTFHRLSAIGVMHISGSPSSLSGTGAAVKQVEIISTQGKKLAGTYTFDVASPNTPKNLSNTSSSIGVDYSDITTNRNNFKVTFCCLPATLTAFKVRVTTTKGVYEKTFSNTVTFTQGQATFFDVSMANATLLNHQTKNVTLMTYNVMGMYSYDQNNLKYWGYKTYTHYWKRPGQSNYVLFDENDYLTYVQPNDNDENRDHIANVVLMQEYVNNQDVSFYCGFNELDCNLNRKVSANPKIRPTPTSPAESQHVEKVVTHDFQLKYLSEKLKDKHNISWAYHFGPARDFGTLPASVPEGEPQRKYGNGVITNEVILDKKVFNLGNGNPDEGFSEENRCVVVVETPDCVFASVHMGGVGNNVNNNASEEEKEEERRSVVTTQSANMTQWFRQNYNNYSKPVFVCGDFNVFPNEISDMMNSQYWTLLSRTDTHTHGGDNGHCLDYIFHFKKSASVELVSSEVITSVPASVAPHGVSKLADHLPMVVHVRF